MKDLGLGSCMFKSNYSLVPMSVLECSCPCKADLDDGSFDPHCNSRDLCCIDAARSQFLTEEAECDKRR